MTPSDAEIDIADVAALSLLFEEARPEAIYHLAAKSHVGDSWVDPTEVLRVNVLGTAAVLAAARAVVPSARVLVVSSAEVYGHVGVDELPLTEASPSRPVSPYAASKLGAEAVAIQAVLGYDQDVVVARPFNHVGPAQSPMFAVAALAQRVVAAERSGANRISVGNLAARRDFTDVRDVVVAYRRLVEVGQPGEIYNICSGVDVAIDEVAAVLLELAKTTCTFEVDPQLTRPADVPVLRGSAAKLHDVTGWSPQIPLRQTLKDTLAYWRTQDVTS